MCHKCLLCGTTLCWRAPPEGVSLTEWHVPFLWTSEDQEDYMLWFESWFTDKQKTLYICPECQDSYKLNQDEYARRFKALAMCGEVKLKKTELLTHSY